MDMDSDGGMDRLTQLVEDHDPDLSLRYEDLRQYQIRDGFCYNDLALLIAFRQLRRAVTSEDQVVDLMCQWSERDKRNPNYEAFYNSEGGPTVPEITRFLRSLGVVQASDAVLSHEIWQGIEELGDTVKRPWLIENVGFGGEEALIPADERRYVFTNGGLLMQSVAHFVAYKSPGVEESVLLDFSRRMG